MSNVMQLVSSNKNLDKTDYKSLYHNLFRHLTSIHNMIEHAQKDIEEQYLIQTEGKVPPKTGIVRKDRLPILKPPEIEPIYEGNIQSSNLTVNDI